jgi:hypothetical protein
MKLSVCLGREAKEARAAAAAMAAAQRVSDGQSIEIFDFPRGALALTRTSDRQSKIPLILRDSAGNILACGGVPITSAQGGAAALLRRAVSAPMNEALDLLASLDGGFSAVLWRAADEQLAVVSDFFGCNPLYMNEERGLIVASELRGMHASGAIPVEPDPIGWGAFISFGFGIGGRTMLARARKFPAATWIVYDGGGRRVRERNYWKPPQAKPARSLEEVDTQRLYDALKRSVTAYAEHALEAKLLLSGGLDSRLILSLLADLGLPIDAMIVDHPGESSNADGRLAVEAARLFGINYELCKPPRNYYGTADFLDYLVRSEVSSPSLYLFIATLQGFLRPNHRAVWEGLVPPATLGNYRSAIGGMRAYLAYACKQRSSPYWQAVPQVFTPKFAAEMTDQFWGFLEAETAHYGSDTVGANEFAIGNRTANRFAPNPYKVFANDVMPFTVGLTKEVWDASAIPTHLKNNEALYLELYRRHCVRAYSLPFCTSAIPINIRGRFNRYRMWELMWKLERRPFAARVLNRIRGSYWRRSELLEDVLKGVEADHPDLNGASVAALKRRSGEHSIARNLLFYWAMWRHVMRGPSTPELAALRRAGEARGSGTAAPS